MSERRRPWATLALAAAAVLVAGSAMALDGAATPAAEHDGPGAAAAPTTAAPGERASGDAATRAAAGSSSSIIDDRPGADGFPSLGSSTGDATSSRDQGAGSGARSDDAASSGRVGGDARPGQGGLASRDDDGHLDVAAEGAGDAIAVDVGPEPADAPPLRSPEGFEVVRGTSSAGDGPTVRYTVEVESAVDHDPLAVAAVVEKALHDPRSWAADVRLVRIDEVGDADIRVVLATPATVDDLCARAGLNTAGRFSCWNGQFAALNAVRWDEGARNFDDLTVYRRYLVNHEVGHGLGYGHVGCPAPGELAPVMMQQTMTTDGCVANGWVYPEVEVD